MTKFRGILAGAFCALAAAAAPVRAAAGAQALSAPQEREFLSLVKSAREARGLARLTNENRARFYELFFLKGDAHSSPLPAGQAHELALLQVDAELSGGAEHLPARDYARILELLFLRGDEKSRPMAPEAARELAGLYLGIKLDQVRGAEIPRDAARRIETLNRARLRMPLPDAVQFSAFKTLQEPVVADPARASDAPKTSAELSRVYDIDAPDSSVTFKVRHLVGSVVGRFGRFSGVFTYDKDKPGLWEAVAHIETASLETTDAWRDEHLRSADFFDAARCRTIELRSTGVSDVRGNAAKLHGDLTIRCVTRPVVLDIVIGGTGPDAEGRRRVVVTGRTTVNRRDFGMTWDKPVPGGVFVGDQVDISIEVQGVSRGS